MEKQSDILKRRKTKLAALREKKVCLFPNDFVVSHTVRDIKNAIEISPDSITENSPHFLISGRIMAINRFGKSAFIRLKDRTGLLQAYVRKDRIGGENFDLFSQLDIGDFVGLKGGMFKTKTEEWTLLVDDLKLNCKAIRPLPEKFHGLKDPEKRYRQRYLDLIMNAAVRDIFIKRSKIIQHIRAFLLDRDFFEVETPMMQPVPGGADATPFKTHHNALGIDLFLRIAPELYLKRLVIGGFERVFEINRNFRNEGISTQHNPEFTMLEFYQAYATYEDMMALTEKMLQDVAAAVMGTAVFSYQGNTIDLGNKWNRMSLMDALKKIGRMDDRLFWDSAALLQFASTQGIDVHKTVNPGKVMTKLFDLLVEPKLIQPTFITGYPVEVSPLSRRNEKNPSLTDRFELFIGGREIANGFSELNDPEDQKGRFLEQAANRAAGDDEAHYMDEEYIEALEYGMPPTAGEGIGIDRLAMLLTDSASIREVILFPHMKPKNWKASY